MTLADIPPDKAQHYIAGTIAATAGALLASELLPGFMWQAAIAAAVLAGVLKELADYLINRRAIAHGEAPERHVEWQDALATALGAVPVALPLLVVLWTSKQ